MSSGGIWPDGRCGVVNISPSIKSADIYRPFLVRPESIVRPVVGKWDGVDLVMPMETQTARPQPKGDSFPASVSSNSSISGDEHGSPPNYHVLGASLRNGNSAALDLTTFDPPTNEELGAFSLDDMPRPPSTPSPPHDLQMPIKKIRNVRKSDKHHCAVCGDRPTGYHYDVLSCNGCKTFFRRTLINKRKFVCAKGGKCAFNKDFRCACRACRFAKCVKVGMNAKAIQFPTKEEPQDSGDDGWQAAEGISNDGMPSSSGLGTSSADSSSALVPVKRMKVEGIFNGIDPRISMVNSEDARAMQLLNSLYFRECSTRKIRSADFIRLCCTKSLREYLHEPSIIGRNQALLDSNDLHKQETQRIYQENPVKFWMVADIVLVVEYAKTFDIFKELRESDQAHLLYHAGGIVQIGSQSFYSLDAKSESITFPDGIDALKERLSSLRRAQYERYYRENYCKPVALMRSLNLTHEEFSIYKALLLFSPNEMELSEEGRRIIGAKREELTNTLRRIYFKNYGAAKGTEKLANTLLSVANFVDIAEKRRNYLEVCDLMATVQLSYIAKGIYLKQFDPDDRKSASPPKTSSVTISEIAENGSPLNATNSPPESNCQFF